MDSLTATNVAVVLLLALGGVAKVARPVPAATALRTVGFATPPVTIRLLGIAETALALAALSLGGALVWALVCAAYVGFVLVGVLLWRNDDVASCGCFGEAASEPGPLHIAVTAIGTVLAGRAAFLNLEGVAVAVVDGGGQGAAAVGVGLGLLAVVVVLLTTFPPLVRAVLEANG